MEFPDLHLYLSHQLVSGRRRKLRIHDFFDCGNFYNILHRYGIILYEFRRNMEHVFLFMFLSFQLFFERDFLRGQYGYPDDYHHELFVERQRE